MKKKLVSVLMVAMMTSTVLAGCGSSNTSTETNSTSESTGESNKKAEDTAAKQEVIEFYHGYFHDESEWAPAKVMRDIYDEFAARYADGPVTFKPIPVENNLEIMNAKVAGGSFPDIIDLAGTPVSLAAVAQKLVYDMKPYIDSEGLQEEVGINYTQNDVDGSIYTVHDQLLTLGLWYNKENFDKAGAELPETWKSWDDFGVAMDTIRKASEAGNYAYGSGEGSVRCFNALLASTSKGIEMLSTELTAETINSEEFVNAFKTIATLDQVNGSANSGQANDFSADFNAGKSGVFFNGVWAAGGFAGNTAFRPAVFPGNIALSSAGGGLTIASGMSEEKTKVALEFVKYMTSEEVQTKIFLEVGANPCNTNLDINKLAEQNGNEGTILLADACTQANSATTIVKTLDAAWGGDIQTAIGNKLKECSIVGADIDKSIKDLQNELLTLID